MAPTPIAAAAVPPPASLQLIAGASAGAINGVMLAKALVDDARLDAQTGLWLDDADSERLAVEQVGRWRKWYLYPVLRALAHWLPSGSGGSRETRRKLSRVVRSSSVSARPARRRIISPRAQNVIPVP